MKSIYLLLAIWLTAFTTYSQTNALDSNDLRTILHIVNERNYLRDLDTINRAQIETLNESVELYSISLETCEKQADNYELIILATDEELNQTKNALRTESRRAKLFKVGLILIPIAFVFGLVI
jgi:hypothetical protein